MASIAQLGPKFRPTPNGANNRSILSSAREGMRKITNVLAFKEAPTTLQAPPRQQEKRKPKSKAKLPTPSSSVENIKIEMNDFLTTHLPQFPVEKMIKETNITAAQRRAIAATKITSPGNQAGGVEMMEADKERKFVQVDSTQRRAMIARAIDGTSYTRISKAEAQKRLTKASKRLKAVLGKAHQMKLISKNDREFMQESIAKGIDTSLDKAEAGKLVVRVKTHKIVTPGAEIPAKIRVIISGTKSCSKNAQAWIGDQLQPIVEDTPTYVQDTAHAIDKINEIVHKRAPIIFTGDVEDMYPAAPRAKCRIIAEAALIKHYANQTPHETAGCPSLKTKRKAGVVAEIEEIVTSNIIFTTDIKDEYVTMGDGYGIGIGHSGQICGLEIASCEQEANERAKARGIQQPSLLIRLQDDILGTFEGSEEELKEFLEIMDDIVAPRIITWETSKREAVWCDLRVKIGSSFRSTGKLDTELYQKPTDKGLYLPRTSHHPQETFKGIMRGEAQRLLVNCSTEGAYTQALNTKRRQFENQGYNPLEVTEHFSHAFEFNQREAVLKHRTARRASKKSPRPSTDTMIAMAIPFTGRTKQLKLKNLIHMINKGIKKSGTKKKIRVVLANQATQSLAQLFRKW